MESEKLVCARCNAILVSREDRCNHCGSNEKIVKLVFEEKMPEIHEEFRLKAKDVTKNKKKNPVLEIRQGADLNRSAGELVNKVREIDKINDTYYEHIERFDGTVIHHCKEKLTDHYGHGSAKSKK